MGAAIVKELFIGVFASICSPFFSMDESLNGLLNYRDTHYIVINGAWVKRTEVNTYNIHVIKNIDVESNPSSCKDLDIADDSVIKAVRYVISENFANSVYIYPPCDGFVSIGFVLNSGRIRYCDLQLSTGTAECPSREFSVKYQSK